MNATEKELLDTKFDKLESLIVSQVSIQSTVNKNVLDSLERIEEQTLQQEKRIYLLEKFQWTLTGKIIGISLAVSTILGLITLFITL